MGLFFEKNISQSEPADVREIKITKLIDAPRQRVWDAWTKPDRLCRWFGVPPVAATRETTSIDLRVGGAWHADMINEKDGSRLPFGGTYLEVHPPLKLVFTMVDSANPTSDVETITVTFKDRTGATEMTLLQAGHLPPDQYGEPLRSGYSAFFARMEQMLRTS